ncbi:helix-turn-helix domain-containing protein [Litoribrevibacter albus]|uniref:Transcriptional regulator n=1 Tax=Litoribrevibacter albus TaxID=1473156 RepID=A0AA37SAA4_9GAMM|nr:AraC family transcriptional regulator [Litoribrevibacter albus]GLQ32272.1 transcriptional regulator [Litoribrevibacter albus]
MELLTGFGLGLLVNIIVVVARDFGRLAVAKVFVVFLLAAVAFLIFPLVPKEWSLFTNNIQGAVPALFWLLCQFAFNDRPRLKNLWSVMAVYSFMAPALARFFWAGEEFTPVMAFWGWHSGQICEYLLISHGLWVIISNWSDDLVESRRKLRVAMLVVVGFAVTTAAVTLNFGLAGEYTRGIIVSISGFIISIFLIKGKDGILFGETQVAHETEFSLTTSQADNEATEAAPSVMADVQQMSEEAQLLKDTMDAGFYRTENLTLKVLAREIGLPEYKVRSLINQTLGYRNFNDYINKLRITDAAKRLIESPDDPILNISLDVGYRSISSFNRAFKEIVGVSPTTYRQQTIRENTVL